MATSPANASSWPKLRLTGVAITITAVLVVSATLVANSANSQPRSEPTSPSTLAQQSSWTVNDCASCHEVTLDHTPHVTLDRDDLTGAMAGVSTSCEACHSGASEHLSSDGESAVFSFSGTAAENTQVCLQCHDSSHPRFNSSDHARAGLECLDCHDSHVTDPNEPRNFADLGLGNRPSASCTDCHEPVFAEFRASERHRIEEGVMECTACHDPHARSARVALGGFKQQQCSQCHTDKSGPWVFEHPAGRVEGCASCHSPHGSPNRHMLNFQRVAEQCYSCHALVPGFHTRFNEETQCTSCHSQIHGSNLHPAFLQ